MRRQNYVKVTDNAVFNVPAYGGSFTTPFASVKERMLRLAYYNQSLPYPNEANQQIITNAAHKYYGTLKMFEPQSETTPLAVVLEKDRGVMMATNISDLKFYYIYIDKSGNFGFAKTWNPITSTNTDLKALKNPAGHQAMELTLPIGVQMVFTFKVGKVERTFTKIVFLYSSQYNELYRRFRWDT